MKVNKNEIESTAVKLQRPLLNDFYFHTCAFLVVSFRSPFFTLIKMDDFLHSDDDENVSDVDPEELQKMLEGLDFSDDEKSSKNAKNDPKVPKRSSNL